MTLWTPEGERNVAKSAPTTAAAPEQELTPEQEQAAEEMAKQMTEARAQILETDARDILLNHAFGIYELAAIHLTAETPKFDEVKISIDALAALLTPLEGQLGEQEATIKEALKQIQLGYVQRLEQAKTTQPN